MPIKTLKAPKPAKQYTWTCVNAMCEAQLTGTTRDAEAIQDDWRILLYFICPHCGWRTKVEAE